MNNRISQMHYQKLSVLNIIRIIYHLCENFIYCNNCT